MTAATLDSAAAPVAAPRANLKWLIAFSVALGALLEVVDTSIVNVALTEMQSTLGATLSQVSWVVSSYAVANVIILPLTAWLGDRFGKKRYFIFSLIAFTLASILCGVSTNLPTLVIARVLQGLGGGGLLAKAQSFLFETFPKSEQAMAQAFFGAVVIAGPAIGPTLGGYIVTNIGWRWIFFINIPVGIGAVMMCMSFLPEDVPAEKRPKGSIDWTSIALLAAGLGCLQTVLEEGQSDDWFDSPFIVTLSVISLTSLVVFVRRQLASTRPVVDLRVLRHRSLWAGSILSVIVGMGLYGALFSVPIFAQSMLHFTSQQTGMLLLPGALCSAAAMPVVGKLLGKYDPRVLLVAGALIIVVALLKLGRLNPGMGADDLFSPLMIRAFGTVLMFLPLNMATLGPLPKEDIGAASGFFSLTRQLGGSIGVALLTTLLAQRQTYHRAMLAAHVGLSDQGVVERVRLMAAGFVARGYDAVSANALAIKAVDGAVSLQAAVMSFGDTFWVTAVLFICSLPLVLLLGKAKGAGPSMAAH